METFKKAFSQKNNSSCEEKTMKEKVYLRRPSQNEDLKENQSSHNKKRNFTKKKKLKNPKISQFP